LSTPPALFAFVILEIGSHFCPGHPELQSSYFKLSTAAGYDSHMPPCPAFFLLR
jgi:hypothetical protein